MVGDHQYKAIAEPDLQVFSESDQNALDKVLELYNGYNALQLSDLSHKFPEWTFYRNLLENKDTKNSYRIDLDHFFEDSPNEDSRLFDDSRELLDLTQELYRQYKNA